jgi:hypothetical protein
MLSAKQLLALSLPSTLPYGWLTIQRSSSIVKSGRGTAH